MTPVVITQTLLGKSVSPHHFVGEGPEISGSTTTESCVKSWRFTLAQRCWVFLFGRCFCEIQYVDILYIELNWTNTIDFHSSRAVYRALSPLRWISGWKSSCLSWLCLLQNTGVFSFKKLHTHDGSMGMVYLPTWMVDFHGINLDH